MANIYSNIIGLEEQIGRFEKISIRVNHILSQFNSNKIAIDNKILERHNIEYGLNEISKELKSLEKRLAKSGKSVNTAINYYFDAEYSLNKLVEKLERPESHEQYDNIFEDSISKGYVKDRNFKTSKYTTNNYGISEELTKEYVDSINNLDTIITLIQAYQTDWEQEEKNLGKYRDDMTDKQRIYNNNNKLLRSRLVVLDWRFGKANKAMENMQSGIGRYNGEFEQYLLDRYIDTIKNDNGRITKEKEFKIQQMIEDVIISKAIGHSYRQIEHITDIDGVNIGQVNMEASEVKDRLLKQLARDTKYMRDSESDTTILNALQLNDTGYSKVTQEFALDYYRKYGKNPFEYLKSPDEQDKEILSNEDYSAVLSLKTVLCQFVKCKNEDAIYASLRAIDTIRRSGDYRYKYEMVDSNSDSLSLYTYHDKTIDTKMSINIVNQGADKVRDAITYTSIGFTKLGPVATLASIIPKEKGVSFIENQSNQDSDIIGMGLTLPSLNPNLSSPVSYGLNVVGGYRNFKDGFELDGIHDIYIKVFDKKSLCFYNINQYRITVSEDYNIMEGYKYKIKTDKIAFDVPNLTIINPATYLYESNVREYNFD